MVDIVNELSERIKPKGRDNCVLPKEMSAELAEELGIHVGDGCLRHKRYEKNIAYQYSVSSGIDEVEYLQGYVIPLLQKLYSLNAEIKYKLKNEIRITYCSKSMYHFKRGLGLPNGKKDNIAIPNVVLNSAYITDFIRGLFDTDGCLQFKDRNKKRPPYPRLDITGKSKTLLDQVNEILLGLEFTTSAVSETRLLKKTGVMCTSNRVYLYGPKNLKRWIELIGFSNPKHRGKYMDWREKYGLD